MKLAVEIDQFGNVFVGPFGGRIGLQYRRSQARQYADANSLQFTTIIKFSMFSHIRINLKRQCHFVLCFLRVVPLLQRDAQAVMERSDQRIYVESFAVRQNGVVVLSLCI